MKATVISDLMLFFTKNLDDSQVKSTLRVDGGATQFQKQWQVFIISLAELQ